MQPRSGEELVIERIATAEDDSEYLPSLLTPEDESSPRVILSTQTFEERLRAACEGHRPLLVFDQFEEILTLFEEAGAGETQQRLVELIVGLMREQLPVKLLFVFREDYLGKVKELLGGLPGARRPRRSGWRRPRRRRCRRSSADRLSATPATLRVSSIRRSPIVCAPP